MTPLEKARAILAEIEALATSNSVILPKTNHYAQIGNAVISCEGVRVTVLGVNPSPWNNPQDFADPLRVMNCGTTQEGIFVISITRNCGGVSNQNGHDDPVKVANVSAQFDVDGELLWEWADNYDAWQAKEWTTRFTIEGELAISSLQMTTGID